MFALGTNKPFNERHEFSIYSTNYANEKKFLTMKFWRKKRLL